MEVEVLCAEPQGLIRSIAIGDGGLRARPGPDVQFQGAKISFAWVHPAAPHRTTRHNLVDKVYEAVLHDIKECGGESNL